jgi:hypothetical protein
MVAPGLNSATRPNRMPKAPRNATAHQFCARTALRACMSVLDSGRAAAALGVLGVVDGASGFIAASSCSFGGDGAVAR